MKQIEVVTNVIGTGKRVTRSKLGTKTKLRRTLHSSIRRILVPVDFSIVSLHALDYAARQAREYGAEIVLLHVVDPILTTQEFLTPRMRKLKAEARRETRKRLALLAQKRVANKVQTECWILEGEPGTVINGAAEKANSDLIIMGSVGRKGIGRFLLGSVAERVVREATCPVTIVPPIQRRIGKTPRAGMLGGEKRGAAVVLIGPPGSGKTTVAQALGSRAQSATIEVGRLLRHEVERGTILGKSIQPFVKTGRLVPQEVVEAVVANALATVENNVVLFDGIPRTTNQIIPFLKTLVNHGFDLFAVIVVDVDAATAMERLSSRRVCNGCGRVCNIQESPVKADAVCDRCGGDLVQRHDDRKEVVEKRWKRFERDTLPVIQFFKAELGRMTVEISGTSLNKRAIDRTWVQLKRLVPQIT